MARKKPKPTDNPWDVAWIASLAATKDYVKEARKVLNKGGFGKVASRADGRGWWVECEGMTGTYQVSVRPDPQAGIVGDCNCLSNKRPCKHVLALLLYLTEHPEERIEPVAANPTKSSDLDGLVRAVFDNPDDDTPRLILADCAEELGQASRAALIRLQCEKARMKKSEKRFKELEKAEKALMPAVLAEMGPLPAEMSVAFHRGFAWLSASYWRQDFDSLPAGFPELFRDGWIESVSLRSVYELPPKVTELLRQVRELDFTNALLQDHELVAIASDFRLNQPDGRLRVVKVAPGYEDRYATLTGLAAEDSEEVTHADPPLLYGRETWQSNAARHFSNLNPAKFKLLAQTGHFMGAESLYFEGEIGDEGVTALLASPGLQRLAQLTFHGPNIGTQGARELANASQASSMRSLTINRTPLNDEGLAAFASGRWDSLSHLGMQEVGLSDSGGSALAAKSFPALGMADFSGNRLAESGCRDLLTSPGWKTVTVWLLRGNPVPPWAWLSLILAATPRGTLNLHFDPVHVCRVERPLAATTIIINGGESAGEGLFDGLATVAKGAVGTLAVTRMGLTVADVASLASALAKNPVRELHLNGNQLKNDSAVALAERLVEIKLEVLDLSQNGIGMAGAKALAASPGLATLRELNLSGNPLRASGVEAIVASPNFKQLRKLTLPGKDLDARRKAALLPRLGSPLHIEFVG